MGTRLVLLVFGVLVSVSLTTGSVEAGDIAVTIVPTTDGTFNSPNETTADVVSSEDVVAPFEPWIHSKMNSKVEAKLQAGFDLAARRIHEVPECRALFTDLGADGIEMLRTTLYFPASAYRETTLCKRAIAVTHVGGAPTVVCRRLALYSDEEAAKVLIHEALHHAGLTEAPQNPEAMSSRVINQTVKKRCDL